jgi:hypothetical protein
LACVVVVLAGAALLAPAAGAAAGVFSLDRLRLGSTAGPEDSLFTAGQLVVADGGVDAGTYYKVVVTDAAGTVRNPAFACTNAASWTFAQNGYAIATADPPSSAAPWKLTLNQYTGSTCAGTPAKTASKPFSVAKPAAYADAALATGRTVFAAGATAYLRIAGLTPGASWNVTWIAPSSATACANTSGSDRPDTDGSGVLPKTGSYIQYRPSSNTSGGQWNRESNYEVRPCPALAAGQDGAWRLRLEKDATTFVVLDAFTLDATAPETTIRSTPASASATRAATFTFDSSEATARFECALDGGAFAGCTSPAAYASLADGAHTFAVRAIDAAGNADPTPATFGWSVDATAPVVTLTAPADGSTTADATPTFSGAAGTATGDAAAVGIEVYAGSSVAGTPVRVLTATRTGGTYAVDAAPALADGAYTARASQQDAAGNTGRSVAITFSVDTAPPDTAITDAPPDPSTSAAATFAFTSPEPGATFQCQLDGGGYVACTSPKQYSGLGGGSHTFSVRARDAAGNTDATPATRTWTVQAPADTTPPAVTLTAPPHGSSTADTTPTFSGVAGTAQTDSATVTVKVYAGTAPSGTPVQTLQATRDATGSYAVDAAPPLPLGAYVAQAEQADVAGNVGASSANAFTIVAAQASYRSEVMADSPSAYWRLGEPAGGTTAYDETGQNNGAYVAGVTLGAPGALNDPDTAASFDGVNDSVTAPDSNSLDGVTGVSLEAWVKRAKGSVWQVIAGKPANGQSQLENYSIWLNSSNQPVAFFGNGTSFARVDAPALDTNWHHVVATYDNANARIYVDGALKATTASTVHLTSNTQPLLIGRDSGSAYFFGGTIDEVAVYPAALSQARIQAHYARASASGGGSDTTPPTIVLTAPGNGSQTSDTTPTFSGTAGSAPDDAATVQVKIYAGQTATGTPVQTLSTTRGAGDAFTVDAATPLAEGTYAAQAEQRDAAGNVGRSSVNTFTVITSGPGNDPVLVGAGDIAYCGSNGDEATAALLGQFPAATVFTLGDNAYESGTPAEFANCYAPSWGQYKTRTRPAFGDHDYADGADPVASGYIGYFQSQLSPFGASATDPNRGWYSYDAGSWHVVVLNSECDLAQNPCTQAAQLTWLANDLASHPSSCAMAIVGAPRFSSGSIHGNEPAMQPFWQTLYDNGAEMVLSGDDHLYERFAPQTPAGVFDSQRGIRQFVVGTGGRSHYPLASKIQPNSEARDDSTYGVMKLTLHATSYDWQFIPEAGRTFTDTGNQACH